MKALIILIILVIFCFIFGAITIWNFQHEKYLYDYYAKPDKGFQNWYICNGWIHKTFTNGFINFKYCGFDPGVHSV